MRTLMNLLVKIIRSHEALILILIGLRLAYIGMSTGRSRKLLLKELMLGDKVIQPIILASFLILLLPDIELIIPQKFIAVLLHSHRPLRLSPLIIDIPQHLLIPPLSAHQRVVNFYEMQHAIINILLGVVIFIAGLLMLLKRLSFRGLGLLCKVFLRVVGAGLLDFDFQLVVGFVDVGIVLVVVDLAGAVAEVSAEGFVLHKRKGTWKVRLFSFWTARMAQLRCQNWMTMLLLVRMQFSQTRMLRRDGSRAWLRWFQSYLLEQPQGIPISDTEVLQKPSQNLMLRKCLQFTPQSRLSGVRTASLSYLLENLRSIDDLLNLEQDYFLILSSRAQVTDFLRWGQFSSGTLSNSDFLVLFPFLETTAVVVEVFGVVSSSMSTVLTTLSICTFLSLYRQGTRKTMSRCCFSMKFLQGNKAQDQTFIPLELSRKWMNSSASAQVMVKGSSQMYALLRSSSFGPVFFTNLVVFFRKKTFSVATRNFCSLFFPSSTSAVFLRYNFENLVLSFNRNASSKATLYLLLSFPSLSSSLTSQKYFPPAADSNMTCPCASLEISSSSIEKLPCVQLSVVIWKGSEVASSSSKASMSWLLACIFSAQKFKL